MDTNPGLGFSGWHAASILPGGNSDATRGRACSRWCHHVSCLVLGRGVDQGLDVAVCERHYRAFSQPSVVPGNRPEQLCSHSGTLALEKAHLQTAKALTARPTSLPGPRHIARKLCWGLPCQRREKVQRLGWCSNTCFRRMPSMDLPSTPMWRASRQTGSRASVLHWHMILPYFAAPGYARHCLDGFITNLLITLAFVLSLAVTCARPSEVTLALVAVLPRLSWHSPGLQALRNMASTTSWPPPCWRRASPSERWSCRRKSTAQACWSLKGCSWRFWRFCWPGRDLLQGNPGTTSHLLAAPWAQDPRAPGVASRALFSSFGLWSFWFQEPFRWILLCCSIWWSNERGLHHGDPGNHGPLGIFPCCASCEDIWQHYLGALAVLCPHHEGCGLLGNAALLLLPSCSLALQGGAAVVQSRGRGAGEVTKGSAGAPLPWSHALIRS